MNDIVTPRAVEAAAAHCLATELLNGMAVPAWLHVTGMPMRVNAAMLRLSGLSVDELAKAEHLSMVAPRYRDDLAASTIECLQCSGEPPARSMHLLSRDGAERPVEVTLRRVTVGGLPAALVTCIDLSDFEHVQVMMLSMGSMLRQIVDGAPVAVYVLDRHHAITHWNSACERLTGQASADMLGSTEHWRAFGEHPRTLLANLIVDGSDPLAPGVDLGSSVQPSSLVTGAFEQEIHLPMLGEEGRWLHFTVAPLRDLSGTTTGAIVTMQDVSQHRRTEDELTRRIETMVNARSAELASHARLMDAFIDSAPIGVAYTVNSRVERVNRRMTEIFGPGSTADETGGSPSAGFFLDPVDYRRLRRMAEPLFARDEPFHHELWLSNRNGNKLWVQVNACPVLYDDTTVGAWWMVQDRSEVRSAQEEVRRRFEELKATNEKLGHAQTQLLQQDKMASIGQLAAGVAHEINNPIGFVSSNLHTLGQYVDTLLRLVEAQARARAEPGDAAAQEDLRRIEAQAELDFLKEDLPQLLDESADGLARVKKIVQDLKDFSRVDHSDWQQADLNAGVMSTLNVVRNEIRYKCDVQLHLGALPPVTCLAGQLNQVFMNLVVNASHAIEERGTITISSGAQDGWAWVQVEDNGCGMTEDVRRRVFEPFFTTKQVGKGTGLGLSLSYSIIKRHEGHFEVRSKPGEGSVFRVLVPVAGPGSMPRQIDAQATPHQWT